MQQIDNGFLQTASICSKPEMSICFIHLMILTVNVKVDKKRYILSIY